ncbi:MAG: TolC family protein [Armatimonadetes bacterium]|nr:TolC family protein [Armatimonadota bacterium]
MTRILVLGFVALSVSALGQTDKLTLEDALRAANENNGTVQAARLNYESAKAGVRSAFSSFLPTVTPVYSREDGHLQTLTGPGKGGSNFDTRSATIQASWLLMDNGTRSATYRRTKVSSEVTEFSTLDTYRGVLFNVHTSFYDALRAQHLLGVAQASLERAKKLEDATIKREQVGAGPRKDILQAKADALNAQVNVLTATNQVSTAEASLKAVLGWPKEELPTLDDSQDTEPGKFDLTITLEEAIAHGLANRPSLQASRKRLEASRLDVTLARLDGSVNWKATANYDRSFSEGVFDRPSLAITASFPLYDGDRSKENVRSAQLGFESDKAALAQTERDARAEIESAYKEFKQNFDRLEAAKLARDAAVENYNAASGAFHEGAGTVLDELTANVSLATAESNYVQAYYDLLISQVRLKQVMGDPLPGERAN